MINMKFGRMTAALALAVLLAGGLAAQEKALDWYGVRSLALGASASGGESPAADAANPAAAATIQRLTLDLSYHNVIGFGAEQGYGMAANLGAVLPTQIGNFTVAGHFATSPFAGLPTGTFGGLNVAFSKDLLSDLDFGVGINFQVGQAYGSSSPDFGLGLDLGFIHKPGDLEFLKDFRWGVALRNLGKALSSPWGGLPANFTPAVGAQFKLIDTNEVALGFKADLAFPTFQNVQFNAGLEVGLFRFVSVLVSYDFDLVQTLNRYNPNWYAAGYTPVSTVSARSVPLSFGLSFNLISAQEAGADGQPAPFYMNSEYNPSVVFTPLANDIAVIGIGLNMPVGVIDNKPPVLEIGDPVFEDETAPAPAADQPAGQTSAPAVGDPVSFRSAPSLAWGADTAAPAGGSAASPAPAASEAAPALDPNVPAPAPSAAPKIDPARSALLATGSPVFISPNFDGVRDQLTIPLSIKDDRPIDSYALIVYDSKGLAIRTVRNKVPRPESADIGTLWERLTRVKTGLTVPKTLVWDGRSDSGNVVADGTYAYLVEARDDNGNLATTPLRPVVVDTRQPELTADSNAPSFAPGGDRPVLVFSLESRPSLSPIETWTGSMLAADGKAVRSWTWTGALPAQAIWDGKNDQGTLAADGYYTFRLATADKAGNKANTEISNLLLLNKPTPIALNVDNAFFSPNADGIKDAVTVGIDANDQVKVNTWSASLLNSKNQAVRLYEGAGALPKSILIDGRDAAGRILPEDAYRLSLSAQYENGNKPTGVSPAMTLDITKPAIAVAAEWPVFSPNGDGRKDGVGISQKSSLEPVWEGEIMSADGRRIRAWTWRGQAEEKLAWDGRDAINNVVADGDYTYQARATDQAGNSGFSNPVVLRVDNRATSAAVTARLPAIAPAGAGPNKDMPLAVELGLRDGVDSWTLRILAVPGPDQLAAATPTFSRDGRGIPAAAQAWNGRGTDGALASDGWYVAEIKAVYAKGDEPVARSAPFRVKNRVPSVTVAAKDGNLSFSPDGDGNRDALAVVQTTSEEETWSATVADAKDNVVRRISWSGTAPAEFVWDGTDDKGNTVPDGDYRYYLSTVDVAGNQAAAELRPIRLATVPPETSLAVGERAFSPKADGSVKLSLIPTVNSRADVAVKDWKIQIDPAAGGSARVISGKGPIPATVAWDGKTDGGRIAPDAEYIARLTVSFENGQTTKPAASPRFVLDTTPPTATAFADPVLFSPDRDGQKDSVTVTQETSKETAWTATIRMAAAPAGMDPVVRSWSWNGPAPRSVAWDGTNDQGMTVPDGRYLYQLSAVDAAGNTGSSAPAEIRVDTRATPLAIKNDKRWFSPGTDPKTRQIISPSAGLTEGIEAWTLEVRDQGGKAVRTFKGTNTPPVAIEWDGKTDQGAMAPDGDYSAAFAVAYLKGNRPSVRTDVFTLDTKAPSITLTAAETVFSPDPDSKRPTVAIQQASSTEELWEGSVQTLDGKAVRSYFWKGSAQNFSWDGRDDNGNLQKDGVYKYVVTATDKAGNATRQELKGIVIDTRPTPVLLMADRRGFAPGTGRPDVAAINFKPLLTLTEGVSSWSLKLVSAGAKPSVERSFEGKGVPPASIVWDGGRDDKSPAPEGRYEAVLTVLYAKGNQPEARSSAFVLDRSGPRAQIAADPKPFSPDDDGVDDEVSIAIAVDDLSPIRDWSLEILESKTDGDPAHFVTFNGQGNPTSRIVWNGYSDTGALVQSAMDYVAVLTVTDNLGNSASYREIIPVDVLIMRDSDGNLRIRIPGINFPANSADFAKLSPEKLAQNNKTLDRLAEILRKYGTYQIVVEGHANITRWWSAREAEDENNKELIPLSEKRAAAVKDALVKRGILANRLTTVGKGGSVPVVPNNDKDNVWKNRRVEFILKK